MKLVSENDLRILRDYITEAIEYDDGAGYLLEEGLELVDSLLESKDYSYDDFCQGEDDEREGLGVPDSEG